jgi:hypothetical protein
MYKEGEKYNEEKQIIQINFDNYHYFEEKKLITKCMISAVDSGEIENKNLIIYHIDLEYLREACYNKNIKKLDELERYCLMLIEESMKRIKKISKGDDVMEKMAEKISKIQMNAFIAGIYDKEEEDAKVRACIEDDIRERALKDGTEEGMKKGIKKGIKEGARAKEQEIITNMLNQGLTEEDIHNFSGIELEFIKRIKNKNEPDLN